MQDLSTATPSRMYLDTSLGCRAATEVATLYGVPHPEIGTPTLRLDVSAVRWSDDEAHVLVTEPGELPTMWMRPDTARDFARAVLAAADAADQLDAVNLPGRPA